MSDIEAVLVEMGYDVFSYSGRGMYGKSCLAIRENPEYFSFDEAEEAAEVLDFNVGDVMYAIDNYHSDQLGLGMVMYWRGIEPPSE